MTEQFESPYSRRRFMQQGLTFASLTATAPLFLQRSAQSMLAPYSSMLSSQPGVPQDRILVVVQLGGGNDGLNTVIPYGMDAYYKARPTIAIPAPGRCLIDRPAALDLSGMADGLGLHPGLSGLKDLMDDGVASIVQGVGYPNPNRSHFTSMDIWHSADTKGKSNGWIGRYFDNTCNGRPIPEGAVSIGREAPLAMNGEIQKPINFESADLFRWLGENSNASIDASYEQINRAGVLDEVDPDGQLGFLMRTALDAQVSSERIRKAVARTPLVSYPQGDLARQLRIVSAMIRDGLATRVYYVSLSGFDTHAGQTGQHANLMRQVGGALKAFHADLTKHDNSSRVLTMVFSEFGRRVAQNASAGTDHGTAAPMFFIGDMVRPGVLGDHPSLTDLDQGDLRFKVDFRCLYAAVLEDWLKAESRTVLNGSYRKAKIIKA